jgi:hypothetical protein
MPDEDEPEIEGEDQASVEDMLQVETLMGWDGDRCECAECRCERFRDGSDATLCGPCLAGDHWQIDD